MAGMQLWQKDFSVRTFCSKINLAPVLTAKTTHIHAWTTSEHSFGDYAALSVHPPRKGDLSMLLHDIVLVVVRQRSHQAKVTDLHSVSWGQQDVSEERGSNIWCNFVCIFYFNTQDCYNVL